MVFINEWQLGLAREHGDDPELVSVVAAMTESEVDRCVDCGLGLGGLLGTFTWGIIHGEGECSNCGFPYRLYHDYEVQPAVVYEGKELQKARVLVLMAYMPLADLPLRENGD